MGNALHALRTVEDELAVVQVEEMRLRDESLSEMREKWETEIAIAWKAFGIPQLKRMWVRPLAPVVDDDEFRFHTVMYVYRGGHDPIVSVQWMLMPGYGWAADAKMLAEKMAETIRSKG